MVTHLAASRTSFERPRKRCHDDFGHFFILWQTIASNTVQWRSKTIQRMFHQVYDVWHKQITLVWMHSKLQLSKWSLDRHLLITINQLCRQIHWREYRWQLETAWENPSGLRLRNSAICKGSQTFASLGMIRWLQMILASAQGLCNWTSVIIIGTFYVNALGRVFISDSPLWGLWQNE